jgi:hypothetical protein
MGDADEGKPNYGGMTVNERLFAAGLLDEFDAAARARDRARMIEILAKVEVGDPAWAVDTILENPAKHGR